MPVLRAKCGILANTAQPCWETSEKERGRLATIIYDAIKNGSTYSAIEGEIDAATNNGALPKAEARDTLLDAANRACREMAIDAPLNYEEYGRIRAILDAIGLDPLSPELKERRWFGFIAIDMSNILYQILHGNYSSYDGLGRMTFHLQRGEEPVFSTGRTVLALYKTVASPAVYQSISLPMGDGVYYRIGTANHAKSSDRTYTF